MNHDSSGSVQSIELHGEYDLSRREELGALLASIDAGKPVILNLTRVTYVDSSFLNELGTLRSRLKESKITLLGVSPQLRRVLSLMRFDAIFDIVDRQPPSP